MLNISKKVEINKKIKSKKNYNFFDFLKLFFYFIVFFINSLVFIFIIYVYMLSIGKIKKENNLFKLDNLFNININTLKIETINKKDKLIISRKTKLNITIIFKGGVKQKFENISLEELSYKLKYGIIILNTNNIESIYLEVKNNGKIVARKNIKNKKEIENLLLINKK